MCSFREYPCLSHGIREFFKDPTPTPPLWKFQLSFIHFFEFLVLQTGFVQVLENLESPGILLWHFPGLESPGKRPLVLESSGNLLNSTKK